MITKTSLAKPILPSPSAHSTREKRDRTRDVNYKLTMISLIIKTKGLEHEVTVNVKIENLPPIGTTKKMRKIVIKARFRTQLNRVNGKQGKNNPIIPERYISSDGKRRCTPKACKETITATAELSQYRNGIHQVRFRVPLSISRPFIDNGLSIDVIPDQIKSIQAEFIED